jgi:hypothetical protein
MKARTILAIVLLSLPLGQLAGAQSEESSSGITAPPNLLLLVYRQIRFDKEGERVKLETAMSSACDRVSVPNSWIDLESVTGCKKRLRRWSGARGR